jgi:hypothetical protein
LERVIRTNLETKGLTGLALDRRKGRFQYAGGPDASEISIVKVDPGWSAGLAMEIERQLNLPFPSELRFSPFRFVIFPEPNAFSLALAYFHAVADAECILRLLRDIIESYRAGGNSGRIEPLNRYTSRWDTPLRLGPVLLARKVAALAAQIRRMRRASRPRYRPSSERENRFELFALEPEKWLPVARKRGVTLNDLFLAVLMAAISRVTRERLNANRRKDVALGCIVNVRKDLALDGLDGGRVFGLFLGSFVVQHEVTEGIKLADLSRAVARQTNLIKRKQLYMGAALELAIARVMVRWFAKGRRGKFYHKNYPLWGGLSNMDLNPLWPQSQETAPVDYLRGVSTGPVTPLVLSFSTLGTVTRVGVSYRPEVFTASDVQRIQECFLSPERALGESL